MLLLMMVLKILIMTIMILKMILLVTLLILNQISDVTNNNPRSVLDGSKKLNGSLK